MTRRKGVARRPSDYTEQGDWPDVALPDHAPIEARYVLHISRTLVAAVEKTSIAQLARDADLSREAIYDLIRGRSWPELVSLARCEQALKTPLWPNLDDLETPPDSDPHGG